MNTAKFDKYVGVLVDQIITGQSFEEIGQDVELLSQLCQCQPSELLAAVKNAPTLITHYANTCPSAGLDYSQFMTRQAQLAHVSYWRSERAILRNWAQGDAAKMSVAVKTYSAIRKLRVSRHAAATKTQGLQTRRGQRQRDEATLVAQLGDTAAKPGRGANYWENGKVYQCRGGMWGGFTLQFSGVTCRGSIVDLQHSRERVAVLVDFWQTATNDISQNAKETGAKTFALLALWAQVHKLNDEDDVVYAQYIDVDPTVKTKVDAMIASAMCTADELAKLYGKVTVCQLNVPLTVGAVSRTVKIPKKYIV